MSKLIGKSVPRLEDQRLLTGRGRFTDDTQTSGACHAVFVRSPHAHARIVGLDVAAASGMPGVRAVLTAQDYAADGHQPIHHHVNGPDAVDISRLAFVATPDAPIFEQSQPPLAQDRVRFVGEIVAVVIADDGAAARDAAEAVQVEYEELPAVVDMHAAILPSATRVWEQLPENTCFLHSFGDEPGTAAAFAAAAHVVSHRFKYQRIVACQMEPRASIGRYDPATGEYTLISGSQGVVRHRICVAHCLSVPKEKVRVVTQDVGGGFGSRTSVNPEAVLVCWAAKRVGETVRWRADRTEAFLGDYQGRDMCIAAALALNRDGKILAIKADYLGNVGAHTVSFVPLANGFRLISTVYDVPVATARMRAVMTNTVPIAPYRGAGRPETTFVVERLLDMAAQRHGFDRLELRRRNILKRTQLPYRNVMGLTYDSGDFLGNMDKALASANWSGFAARRATSAGKGLLRGIGIANYVESPVGAVNERIEVTLDADGRVGILSGTQSTGQGHETVFAQVVGEQLGVTMDRVTLLTGDSDKIEVGGGTHSDRTMRLGGTLLYEACGKIVAAARSVAADLLGSKPDDLRFEDGRFSTPTSNTAVSLADVARATGQSLQAVANLSKRIPSHPTGCAVCEVEIDPETGVVRIADYVSIDDVGQAINPMIVDGQVYGGIAMGIGESLYESFEVDRQSGQVGSASFMDYAVTRASCLPRLRIALVEDPTAINPLRVKGGGECGVTPAAGAIINAIVDALSGHGIEHLDMPATPSRVWQALQDAGPTTKRSEA